MRSAQKITYTHFPAVERLFYMKAEWDYTAVAMYVFSTEERLLYRKADRDYTAVEVYVFPAVERLLFTGSAGASAQGRSKGTVLFLMEGILHNEY